MKTPDSIHCRPGTTDAMQRLADENEALRAERDQATEAVQNLTEGVPFGEIVGMHTIANMERSIKALTSERDELAASTDVLRKALLYSSDYLDADGMNAVCHRSKAHMEMKSALSETPAQSLAHIRAAGAREALERAMKVPGFSDTVVRVDLMREIIEKMEGEV